MIHYTLMALTVTGVLVNALGLKAVSAIRSSVSGAVYAHRVATDYSHQALGHLAEILELRMEAAQRRWYVCQILLMFASLVISLTLQLLPLLVGRER